MYKIYINDTPLILCQSTSVELSDTVLKARYNGKPASIFNYIDLLEKTQRFESVYLIHSDVVELFNDFQSLFKIVYAAGGLILDEEKRMLFILRRGYWDLPKGKIEKNESVEDAAIREVKEETGILNIQITGSPIMGYHTYKIDQKRILKPTYWFPMYSEDKNLVLQSEEDIEDAIWAHPMKFLQSKPIIYNNLIDLILTFCKTNI
jgi:8-oxo-dGTP pyrophosphatase MutT (NUDIX family)